MNRFKKKTFFILLLIIFIIVILVLFKTAFQQKSHLTTSQTPSPSSSLDSVFITSSTKENVDDTDIQICERFNNQKKDKKLYNILDKDSITEKYFQIWKQIVMEKWNIDEKYFDKHIEVYDYEIEKPQTDRQIVRYFKVIYTYKTDWVNSETTIDSFIINVDYNNKYGTDQGIDLSDLSPDGYLNKDQILRYKRDITYKKTCNFGEIPKTEKIVFESCPQMIRDLKDKLKVEHLEISKIYIEEGSLITVIHNISDLRDGAFYYKLNLSTGKLFINKIHSIH